MKQSAALDFKEMKLLSFVQIEQMNFIKFE